MSTNRDVRSLSVLIPTYQDMHLLAKSLPVVLEHDAHEIDIVILNNDPSQDVVSWLDDSLGIKTGDRVKVVEMGADAGFARAINRGISITRGDLLFICNADLFPSPNYIEVMSSFFNEHPQAGLASGKILRYDLASDTPTGVIDTAGLIFGRNRRFLQRGEGYADNGRFSKEEEVFGVDGAALFARRTALESISLEGEYFDESFFMHKEDWDLSWRIRLMGWECWYVPQAVAFHARTSRSLGEAGYLSAMKAFHENELTKPDLVRFHALKNQWLMLVKNEDFPNLWRDLPFILSRELMVLGHNLVFSPRTLLAVGDFARLLPRALAKRHSIKQKQTADPSDVRRWVNQATAPEDASRELTTA